MDKIKVAKSLMALCKKSLRENEYNIRKVKGIRCSHSDVEAYRVYAPPEDTILIILADTLEEAKTKAQERWNSPFITVKPVFPTQDPQVYEA